MTKKILLLGVPGVGKTTTAHFIIQKLKAQNKKVALINLDFYSILHNLYTFFVTNVLFQKLASWELPEFYGKYSFKAELNQQKYLRLKEATKRLILLRYLLLVTAMFLAYIMQKILSIWYDILIEHEGHVLKSVNTFHFILYTCDIKRFNMNFVLRVLPIILKDWIVIYFPIMDYSTLKKRYERRGTPIEPYDYLYTSDLFYKTLTKYLKIKMVNISDPQTLWSIINNELTI